MPLPKLSVAPSQRHLQTADGRPFFWLADTAWTLVNNLNREQARHYFANRRDKGFSVIHIVALDPETDIEMKSAYGDRALIGDDPLQPNEKFFAYLDEILDLAQEHGLYVALVPAWGQLVTGDDWGARKYPVRINESNAAAYGQWIGARYRNRTNIIWMLGGDRHPVHLGRDYRRVWRAMVEGIGRGVTGKVLQWNVAVPAWREVLMTYHPSYSDDPPICSSSHWLHDAAWLSFNLIQSAHRNHVRNYDFVYWDYQRQPVKPVLDGEPNYEDWVFRTPGGFDFHTDWNVRKRAYWSLFAGSCGHTYGHTSIWPMVDEKRRSEHLRFTWDEALDRPGAQQMRHVRSLIESRPLFDSVPDQNMTGFWPNFLDVRIQARRDANGEFAFVYFTSGREAIIYTHMLADPERIAWWFNPRDGKLYDASGSETNSPFARIKHAASHTFTPPTLGERNDWVLVLDSSALKFDPPGQAHI
jgi:hypothetical protein